MRGRGPWGRRDRRTQARPCRHQPCVLGLSGEPRALGPSPGRAAQAHARRPAEQRGARRPFIGELVTNIATRRGPGAQRGSSQGRDIGPWGWGQGEEPALGGAESPQGPPQASPPPPGSPFSLLAGLRPQGAGAGRPDLGWVDATFYQGPAGSWGTVGEQVRLPCLGCCGWGQGRAPVAPRPAPGRGVGSGLRLQGAHAHAGQAEPGPRQLLALAVRLRPDVQGEVARVEEEEGPQAGRLARGLHLRAGRRRQPPGDAACLDPAPRRRGAPHGCPLCCPPQAAAPV